MLPHSPLPHARIDSECKRWNLEHVVLDLFSHFTLGKVQWLSHVFLDLFSHIQTEKSNGCLSLVMAHVRPTHPSPFRVLRTSLTLSQPGFVSASPHGNTSTDVCGASPASNSMPSRHWTGQFLRSLQLSWKLAATCTRHRPSEADIARERKLLQLRHLLVRSLQNLAGSLMELGRDSCALGSEKAESAHVFASRAFVTVTLAANMRGMWTQIVYEENTDRVHPQLLSHSPTHWITQEALLDMIDAIDADMHARPGDAEQQNFTAYTQPLDRALMRALKSSIRSEVAKHFAEFFLEAESNFERANLDSTTSVLRQLLLSFAHTAAAQNADSPQHRAAGWRLIDWNEVEQRELLEEAKRLLELGELFPRGTAEEPHAPDAEAEATDSEPEAHVLEPLADDHSSDGEDAPTGVEESAAPAAPAVAAAPEQQTTITTALCFCVARKMSSASPASACVSASIASPSFVVASMSIHSTCVIVVSICLHVFHQFHRLHSE